MKFGVIILAAGASRRMGTPKQLLRLGKQTLLNRQIDLAASLRPAVVVVVLGAGAETISGVVDRGDVHWRINSRWEEGMGGSVAVGVKGVLDLVPDVEACLLMLVDQPLISRTHLQNLIRQLQHSDDHLGSVSAYADTVGVPALFRVSLFFRIGFSEW